VWGAELTMIERELIQAGVNPAMDPIPGDRRINPVVAYTSMRTLQMAQRSSWRTFPVQRISEEALIAAQIAMHFPQIL